MFGRGLGGVAATSDLVLVSDRDPADAEDVLHALAAGSGEVRWMASFPAAGELDYGNSPRATPLIHEGRVFLWGAFGDLRCLELDTGQVLWEFNLRQKFGATDKPDWGTCSSPLLVEGMLIVNPGAPRASLVALRPADGELIWQTPGDPAGFGSLIVAQLGGRRQIVGHDKISLGGWDPQTGRRLWRLDPPRTHDFNVPTPIQIGDQLLVCTENNGTRLYAFDDQGRIIPRPVAVNRDLAPDAHSPVVQGDKVWGVWNGLHCLDLQQGLKTLWTADDPAYADYASLIAAPDRLLVTSKYGELILLDGRAGEHRVLSRARLFQNDSGVLSHPALVGQRLYVRSSTAVVCIDLGP
jgi:outer membrane protein assembly factor BamB